MTTPTITATAGTMPSSAPALPRSGALWLLRLRPDLAALSRWAAVTGQRALREDVGYALHAALRATLGEAAPQPFALQPRPDGIHLVGYVRQPPAALQRAAEVALTSEPGAAAALGLGGADGLVVRAMPQDWRAGERFSFEARVAPVVRSRQAGNGEGYPEIDAAFHPAFCGDAPGDREAAHRRWLARELQRGEAAELLQHRVVGFQLAPIARRSATRGRDATANARTTRTGLLPDLTVRGQLQVCRPQAFQALLARGVGRHRSFGFGCLLLAPAGAWT